MIYVALIYLIIVTFYMLIAISPEFKTAVIKSMKDESPDIFEVIDAEKLYNKLHVLIILLSPILILISLVQFIFRTISK